MEIISFDTNILINIFLMDDYKYMEFKFYVDQQKEHIYIPQQVKKEYEKNFYNKFGQIKKLYREILEIGNKFETDALKNFAGYKDFPSEYVEVIKNISSANAKWLSNYIKSYSGLIERDSKRYGTLKSKINYEKNIWNYNIINIDKYAMMSEDEIKVWIEEYDRRINNNENIVGSRDYNKNHGGAGDYIILKELEKIAKEYNKDIIFVTDDEKRDWKENGQFRDSIADEFKKETGHKITLWNKNDFMENMRKKYSYYDNVRNYEFNKPLFFSKVYLELNKKRAREVVYKDNKDAKAAAFISCIRRIMEYLDNNIIFSNLESYRYSLRSRIFYHKGDSVYEVMWLYVHYEDMFIINLADDSPRINKIETMVCDISREKFLCLLSELVELIESKFRLKGYETKLSDYNIKKEVENIGENWYEIFKSNISL